MKIIKSYGEFWRRDLVRWDGKKEILGTSKNQSRRANFWDMKGIYALYFHSKLIYIGQSSNQSIGVRLKSHTKDELKNHWNLFSWYGIRDVLNTGKDNNNFYRLGTVNKRESVKTEDAIAILETLAIRIADPDLNRQRRRFRYKKQAAEHFVQFIPKEEDKFMKIEKEFKIELDKKYKTLHAKIKTQTKILQKQLSSHTKKLNKIKNKL